MILYITDRPRRDVPRYYEALRDGPVTVIVDRFGREREIARVTHRDASVPGGTVPHDTAPER